MQLEFGKILIVTGILLVVAGLALYLIPWLRLGKLPGDFVFRRGDWTVYLPLASCLVVSILLSLVLWLVNILRK